MITTGGAAKDTLKQGILMILGLTIFMEIQKLLIKQLLVSKFYQTVTMTVVPVWDILPLQDMSALAAVVLKLQPIPDDCTSSHHR